MFSKSPRVPYLHQAVQFHESPHHNQMAMFRVLFNAGCMEIKRSPHFQVESYNPSFCSYRYFNIICHLFFLVNHGLQRWVHMSKNIMNVILFSKGFIRNNNVVYHCDRSICMGSLCKNSLCFMQATGFYGKR
jgi:hypothetical protein